MVDPRKSDAEQHAQAPAWHAMDVDGALAALGASREGLNEAQVARRLAEHGRNELPMPPVPHPLRRLLAQFNNALIGFLLGAAVVSALLAHWLDAAVILAVVVVNALIGFIQEGRAEQALAALRSMLAPSARVLREGHRHKIAVSELVPGDIVVIEAGDRVPADLRLLRARGMLADESILTGESLASSKDEAPVHPDAVLGDRASMLYSGTLVAAGQGTGLVVATGAASEFGKISALIGSAESLQTPLLRQINRFGQRFTLFALGVSALLFVFAVMARDYAWIDAFMLVVAVAVSLIPEGLPAVITITLAIGVSRMAGRNAIIRRLPAVETLGATTVICSDKTGTLTRNEMTARRMVTANAVAMVGGAGYAPHGAIEPQDGSDEVPQDLRELARVALLCNDAELREKDGQWHVDGDPMEGALLALAAKAGLDAAATHAALPRLDEIPFDARHRFMATLHRSEAAGAVLMVKGAPDALLALASAQLDRHGRATALEADHWHRAIAAAADGERVLGFAWRRFTTPPEKLAFELVDELVFVGVIGFMDPLREEALTSVADCRTAGIAVKMITGDHGATALAIARQLGMADDPRVVTGVELDLVSDADLPALARETSVFARTSPEHKLRVVRALQSLGEVVAMTGDGVNDAPSLKQANVGVAMGIKGTEAAKEASEMVLADDNFASIVAAVSEGRTVYDNIRKVIAWTMPTNGGEVLAIIGALALGLTLPMTPVQVLWINLVSSVTLGVALAFEPAEPGVMQRAPRRTAEGLVSGFMLWRIGFVSILFTAGVVGIFSWAIQRGYPVELARTMVVNTLCVLEMFYLFNVRYLHMTSFTLRGARGTPAVLWAIVVLALAQLAFTYAPWMQLLFNTRAVALLDLLLIIGIGVALMVVLEAEKMLMRRVGWLH